MNLRKLLHSGSEHDGNDSSNDSSNDDDLYHGIGITFLILAPIIGGFCVNTISNTKYSAIVHFINSFAGGILLGTALLHFLPDGVSSLVVNDIEGYPYPYLITGCMLLFMYMLGHLSPYTIENVFNTLNIIKKKEVISSLAFFFGLLIHGIFEGFAVGILTASSDSWATLGVLFVHKIIEFAALSSSITIANLSIIHHWILLSICELPCLITFIATWKAASSSSVQVDSIFSLLGAGTFLYISLGHLIPECLDINLSHNYNLVEEIKVPKVDDTIAKQTCACCKDDNCTCGENCQCSNAVLGETITTTHTKAAITSEFGYKLRAFAGISLGYIVFALLALKG